jgi:hypothetical protein
MGEIEPKACRKDLKLSGSVATSLVPDGLALLVTLV